MLNRWNFLKTGFYEGSKVGTYYLTVEPGDDSLVGIGYEIGLNIIDQDDAGQGQDAADHVEMAQLIEKGKNHVGGVGDLDYADYYKFNATLDTELLFQVLKYCNFDLVLLDADRVEVCRNPIREAPRDEFLTFKFSGADSGPGCDGELGEGPYVVAILGELNSQDSYTISLK